MLPSECWYFLIFCFTRTHLRSDDAYLEIFWHQVCSVNCLGRVHLENKGWTVLGKEVGFFLSLPQLAGDGPEEGRMRWVSVSFQCSILIKCSVVYFFPPGFCLTYSFAEEEPNFCVLLNHVVLHLRPELIKSPNSCFPCVRKGEIN